MGLLVKGVWQDQSIDTKISGGRFVRAEAQFRNWITEDGAVGSSGEEGFKAEPGRYHLYVSLACPWAHRTLIIRKLKELEEVISVSVVSPDVHENGWEFNSDCPDRLYDSHFLYQLYQQAKADYNGRVAVPVLWDQQKKTIVSNESSEIIRMFNTAFNSFIGSQQNFYPEALRSQIDEINDFVYHNINNGVYKCGFASEQEAYEEACYNLFNALDKVDALLKEQPFLVGGDISEADWRLFTTLLRFDPVYVGHFKCNLKRIADYPHLSNYLRQLYQVPGVADTVDMTHIKRHYYVSHRQVNPTGIVPVGPEVDLSQPHNRGEVLLD